MKPIEITVDIDAPIERVWRSVVCFGEYPKWNPFIVGVDGPSDASDAVGERIILHVRWSDGTGVKSPERVLQCDAPTHDAPGCLVYKYDAWMGRFGLIHAVRHQWVSARSEGGTRWRSTEAFSGPLTRFLPMTQIIDGFQRHGAALKAYAESA